MRACRRSPKPSSWPVPPPQPPGRAARRARASSDFDAKWTAEMIAGHERSVALYRAQAQGGEDKDLRKYARDTLPTIEQHLAATQEIAEMTSTENNMLTMRIIKLLGIAGIAILAASFVAARAQRRDEEERRRLNEQLEKERWESEGGASRTGPATQSAVTAH